jgi:hypothetical protein
VDPNGDGVQSFSGCIKVVGSHFFISTRVESILQPLRRVFSARLWLDNFSINHPFDKRLSCGGDPRQQSETQDCMVLKLKCHS